MDPHSNSNNILQVMKSRWKYLLCFLIILIISSFLLTRDTNEPSTSTQFGIPSVAPISTSSPPRTVANTPRLTIVAFGDSITAGYGISVEDAYPAILGRLLTNEDALVSVINSGVSGETTAGGLRRVDFVVAQKPDIIIVALGGNDVLRGIPPEITKNNLAQIIEKFQKGNVRVILAGMYAPSNLGEAYVAEFNAIYPTLSKKYNVPLVPFLLEGVALNPELNQPDGIHPNQEGARIIAKENILPAILPLLSLKID